MGLFNATCFLTGQQIESGDPVAMVLMNEKPEQQHYSHLLILSGISVSTVIFGKYSGYGDIETDKFFSNPGNAQYMCHQDLPSGQSYAIAHRKAYDCMIDKKAVDATCKILKLAQEGERGYTVQAQKIAQNPEFSGKTSIVVLTMSADRIGDENLDSFTDISEIRPIVELYTLANAMESIGKRFTSFSHLQNSDILLTRKLARIGLDISERQIISEDEWIVVDVPKNLLDVSSRNKECIVGLIPSQTLMFYSSTLDDEKTRSIPKNATPGNVRLYLSPEKIDITDFEAIVPKDKVNSWNKTMQMKADLCGMKIPFYLKRPVNLMLTPEDDFILYDHKGKSVLLEG